MEMFFLIYVRFVNYLFQIDCVYDSFQKGNIFSKLMRLGIHNINEVNKLMLKMQRIKKKI